jgi:hypothetical protein
LRIHDYQRLVVWDWPSIPPATGSRQIGREPL